MLYTCKSVIYFTTKFKYFIVFLQAGAFFFNYQSSLRVYQSYMKIAHPSSIFCLLQLVTYVWIIEYAIETELTNFTPKVLDWLFPHRLRTGATCSKNKGSQNKDSKEGKQAFFFHILIVKNGETTFGRFLDALNAP